MTKVTLIGGEFNDLGGNKSPQVDLFHLELLLGNFEVQCLNGGYLSDLPTKINSPIVFFLAQNPDYLQQIKKTQPHLLLVMTPQNSLVKSAADLIGEMLDFKANLGILWGEKNELLDPLGNIYCQSAKLSVLVDRFSRRYGTLQKITRKSSLSVGDTATPPSELSEFLVTIKPLTQIFKEFVEAKKFHKLTTQELTRCAYGFPAMRTSEGLFVAPRDAQQELRPEDFIKVNPLEKEVQYFGSKKPTVESPLFIKIFNAFPKINYILHGHIYAETELFTRHKLPCGTWEEIFEIKKLISPDSSFSVINLRGHGCLILAEKIEDFKSIKINPRPLPEN